MNRSPTHQLVANLGQRIVSGIISFDVYAMIVMTVYSVLALIYFHWIPNSSSIIFLDLFVAVGVGALILVHALTEAPLFAMLRRFYIIPIVYLMYDQVHMLVPIVHPVDYDTQLIAADRWIFGVDPTHWFQQFASPLLTEYFQICYFLFYVMPIMQAVELWKRGDMQKLDLFTRGIAFCYFISYLGYFVMPAIGPRFTLHDFSHLDAELPGFLLTPWIRDMIDVGGGIAQGIVNPQAIVNRDCMPSGHTMMTVVNIYFGLKFKSRFRYIFVVIGGSLIISTVYLRYHYAVDVIVGILLAAIFLPIEPAVNRLISSRIFRLRSMWKTD